MTSAPMASTPMTSTMAPAPMSGVPTPASTSQSIEAVKILSQAAMSPAASDHQAVVSIANVAVSNISTSEGVHAIDHLVKQAIVAESGDSSKVKKAVSTAIMSISDTSDKVQGQTQEGSCFPTRQYDMSKVKPQTDGVDTFEDYQTWAPMK